MKTVLPGTVQAQTRIVRTGNFDLTLITGSLGYPHFKLHQEADTKNVVFLPPNKKPYWFDFGWLANHDVMVHIFGLYDEQELLDAELLKLKRLVCVSQYDNCLADVETILPNGQVVAAEQGMPAHLETYFWEINMQDNKNQNVPGYDAKLEVENTAEATEKVKVDLQEFPLKTGNEILGMTFPQPEYICGEWLKARSINMVFAKAGAGKSIFTLSVSLALAAQKPVFGWAVPRPVRVLYLDADMEGGEFAARIAKLSKGANIPVTDNFMGWNADMPWFKANGDNRTLNLAETADQSLVTAACLANKIEMLVIDNISTLFYSPEDENDAGSWHSAMQWAFILRKHGIGVLFVHHANKGNEQRGTSMREVQTEMNIRLTAKKRGFRIESTKARSNQQLHVDVTFMPCNDDEIVMSYGRASIENEVYKMADVGMTPQTIGRALETDEFTVRRILMDAGMLKVKT